MKKLWNLHQKLNQREGVHDLHALVYFTLQPVWGGLVASPSEPKVTNGSGSGHRRTPCAVATTPPCSSSRSRMLWPQLRAGKTPPGTEQGEGPERRGQTSRWPPRRSVSGDKRLAVYGPDTREPNALHSGCEDRALTRGAHTTHSGTQEIFRIHKRGNCSLSFGEPLGEAWASHRESQWLSGGKTPGLPITRKSPLGMSVPHLPLIF